MLQRVEAPPSCTTRTRSPAGAGWCSCSTGRALFVGSKKVHKTDYDELLRQQHGDPALRRQRERLALLDVRRPVLLGASSGWSPDEVYAALVSGDFNEHRASPEAPETVGGRRQDSLHGCGRSRH